jgi:hypothetical protein
MFLLSSLYNRGYGRAILSIIWVLLSETVFFIFVLRLPTQHKIIILLLPSVSKYKIWQLQLDCQNVLCVGQMRYLTSLIRTPKDYITLWCIMCLTGSNVQFGSWVIHILLRITQNAFAQKYLCSSHNDYSSISLFVSCLKKPNNYDLTSSYE